MTSCKQSICDTLLELAKHDSDILVLCSDSRGSASASEFASELPEQFVETGIAEQNLVSIAAGLASSGMKPFVLSPAAFLSSRSLEQIKVDICYSKSDVKLIGVSGGVSYGPLGLTHHAIHDIAALGVLPGLRIYMPADAVSSAALIEHIAGDGLPAYIRVGRNASQAVYTDVKPNLNNGRAIVVRPGSDVTIIACGDMVYPALQAAEQLAMDGIACRILDMYCIKPLDEASILDAACETRGIITVEEHSLFLGLGSLVAQTLAGRGIPLKRLGLPDEPVITGKQQQILDYYHLNSQGIMDAVREVLSS